MLRKIVVYLTTATARETSRYIDTAIIFDTVSRCLYSSEIVLSWHVLEPRSLVPLAVLSIPGTHDAWGLSQRIQV
jgi:hypothetical protein